MLDARFPGQWFQLESGLHYNWHRHYDPTLGRYTQPDPLGFVDGPSVYGYAKLNPQIHVDPSGENTLVTLALTTAKWCLKNPTECTDEFKKKMCPALETAKKLSCAVPGCSSPSMQSKQAHSRLRAAEACLAARDAIEHLCPKTATEKHKRPYPEERKQYESKANKCFDRCSPNTMRI